MSDTLEPTEEQIFEMERLSRIHRSDPRVHLIFAYVRDIVLEEVLRAGVHDPDCGGWHETTSDVLECVEARIRAMKGK